MTSFSVATMLVFMATAVISKSWFSPLVFVGAVALWRWAPEWFRRFWIQLDRDEDAPWC